MNIELGIDTENKKSTFTLVSLSLGKQKGEKSMIVKKVLEALGREEKEIEIHALAKKLNYPFWIVLLVIKFLKWWDLIAVWATGCNKPLLYRLMRGGCVMFVSRKN